MIYGRKICNVIRTRLTQKYYHEKLDVLKGFAKITAVWIERVD